MHTFRTVRSRALAVVTLGLTVALTVPALPASAEDSAPAPLAAATISKLTPGSGVTSGGAVVTITGTGFTDVSAVTLGSVRVTRFDVVSAVKLTVITPPLEAGTYPISVTTPAGTTTAGKYTVRTFTDEVLRLVNEARSTARKCGSTKYKAVPPVRADATLARVATAHSADMARRDYFSHTSKNGDSPFDRMKDAGYRYSSAGENIAAGFRTPSSVVNAWLKSPGHCRNIMKRSYTELGVGYAVGGTYGTYWTQDFGNPR